MHSWWELMVTKEVMQKICSIMTAGLLFGCRPKSDPFAPLKTFDAIKCYKDTCEIWDIKNNKCGLRG